MPNPSPPIRRELKIQYDCPRGQAAQLLIPSPHRRALKISKPFENQQETHKALAKLRRAPEGLERPDSPPPAPCRLDVKEAASLLPFQAVWSLWPTHLGTAAPLGQKVGTMPSLPTAGSSACAVCFFGRSFSLLPGRCPLPWLHS